jgi:ATP-dependent Lon protease
MPIQQSRTLNYPRWLNSDAHGKSKGVAASGEQQQKERTTSLDGSEKDDEGGAAQQEDSSPPSSSSSDDGNSSDSNSSSSSSPPPEDSAPPPPSSPSNPGSIAKQSVPENYPQVLALPIARRPLFPGFYKAVVVKNPDVVAAIKDMMKRGQPYIGAFLLKDENTDSDVITDANAVYPVGVFAQITSVFSAGTSTKEGEEKEEALTAVLYPHRRIRMTELVKAGGQAKVETADEPQTVTPPETPVEQNLPLGPCVLLFSFLFMVVLACNHGRY